MLLESGLTRLTARPLHELESIAIAGESAAAVGEVFAAAGGPPLVLESDHFAFLSRNSGVPSAARVRDLPEDSVDLVVLRRAWRSPVEVGTAIAIGRDRVVPGGEVIAADLDVNRLLAGPSSRYPSRLLYLAAPEASVGLRASTASPALLSAEAVRASLGPVDMITYDDVRGDHETIGALWDAIRQRGWRGAAWTPSDRQAEVMETAASSLASAVPSGRVRDLEPWYAVVGPKR